MKKKIWLAAFGTAVLLTACGGQGGQMEETAEIQAGETAGTTETAEATAVETDIKENEAPKEAGEYEKGIVTEDGWESEWLGIRYKAPAGMKMSTEEELNEIMELGREMLSQGDSGVQPADPEVASVLEMMSTDEGGTINVILTAEKLSGELTGQDYAEALMQKLLDVSVAEYQVAGSNEALKLGGLAFHKVTCQADYQGAALYQDYYVTVFGDRAVTIAVTYSEESAETAKTIVDAFDGY